MNLKVHPEVAGIAERLAAVLALMRLHPYMPHEMHVELSGSDESPRAHAALELLLPRTALAFPSGGDAAGVPAAAAVRLSRGRVVTGPGGRRGAGAAVEKLFLRGNVLGPLRWRWLLLRLRVVLQ